MRTVRIAVVGAGYMGRHHAEKVASFRDQGGAVALVGVADLEPARAERVAKQTGCRAVTDVGELFGAADAAIVAVPTSSHFDVARRALEAGLDVLVEKPIAATLAEAKALAEVAAKRERVLQVGHQEWFNPALRVLRDQLSAPRFVEAHRMGSFTERGADVDVVRDLMIHDLDILQQLLGEEPARIESIGVPVVTDEVDIANARLTFASGCVANFTASRVSAVPMRKFRCFQRDGYFSIDFLAQSAAVFRRHAGEGGARPRIEMEEIKLDPEDALTGQLLSFVESVNGREPPVVSGAVALRALRTALRVVEAMPSVGELE